MTHRGVCVSSSFASLRPVSRTACRATNELPPNGSYGVATSSQALWREHAQLPSRQHVRAFAVVRDDVLVGAGCWFTGSAPSRYGAKTEETPAPDERTLRLGKTVRVLHERLPTLLASPLPQEVLSPQISLHLFPSTHPHLPTVSGRVGYTAALWTAPMAWGRVPVVGNIKLEVLSERMVKNGAGSDTAAGYSSSKGPSGPQGEKLIVRWRTCGKTKGRGRGGLYRGIGGGKDGQVDKITEFLGGHEERDDMEFTGLFIFEFDEEGRVARHTIEHAQHGDAANFERMTRVVSVTDWLLGLARNRGVREPEYAFQARGQARSRFDWT